MYDICIKNKDAKWYKSSCHVVSIDKVYNRKRNTYKNKSNKDFFLYKIKLTRIHFNYFIKINLFGYNLNKIFKQNILASLNKDARGTYVHVSHNLLSLPPLIHCHTSYLSVYPMCYWQRIPTNYWVEAVSPSFFTTLFHFFA